MSLTPIVTDSESQQAQLKQRVEELSVLYELSMLLSAHGDVQQVLDAAAHSAAMALKVKAVSIRLLSDDGQQLHIKAVHNLSEEHLAKGPVSLEEAPLHQRALQGEMVYVQDLITDPRVIFPEDARREGIVSVLSTGMIYQGKPMGVIRLYTAKERAFSDFEISLLKAVAQLVASAIYSTRLNEQNRKAQQVQQQLRLAGDVQKRMLPATIPQLKQFDIAADYIPTLELSGDFYDLIQLNGHIGIAIGDVVGKGVAASLLMASVRSSLRAYAQDLYDISQIIHRVNVLLTRDTLDNEFATLFYGVLDPDTNRLTYCNAGHNPPLLLRNGEVTELDVGGLIVGIDEQATYDMAIVHFQPGDLLLLFSDGMNEAKNFDNVQFGKERIIEAMKSSLTLPDANAMLKHILWQMRCFTGLHHNADDTTAVLIHALPG